ncbi:MAG: sugar ABC transporter permease [Spirochaetales bacterium]|nr:sugar ABC transporter permease [Spirochaetales bacterium]
MVRRTGSALLMYKKSMRYKLGVVGRNFDLYALLIPGMLFILIFRFTPIAGMVMAFQDFNIFEGFRGSEWVGLAQFRKLFGSIEFYRILRNTLLISGLKIFFITPMPIVTAILLNEIRLVPLRKGMQTIVYLPHFFSWVIASALFLTMLSPFGIINRIITPITGEPILFFMNKGAFLGVIVVTHGWKEVGWTAIIYLAAIAGIDPSLYESATIDGAGRIRKIVHITFPSIASTIVVMYVMRLGSLLEAGTQQILMMYNPIVYEISDIIGTFVYRKGLAQMEYSFSTAVGFFNSVVAFLLIISANKLSRRISERSIW